MTTIKLTKAGEALTMFIDSCAMAPTGKYPEVLFVGRREDDGTTATVPVPKSSADRQLGRMGKTMAGVIGHRLTFSRHPNPGDASKPYWGITLEDPSAYQKPANGGRPNPPTALPTGVNLGSIPGLDEAPLPPPPEDAARQEESAGHFPLKNFNPTTQLRGQLALYDFCFAHALKVAARAKEIGFEVDPAAICATLYIQANKSL